MKEECISNEEKIGKALKLMYERIKAMQPYEKQKIKHICSNCKFKCTRQGYDQEWGYYFAVENWCSKDKNLMHTFYAKGNDKYFTEDCDFFTEGKGIVLYD